jgi:RNA polymerase sigma factor (sigma-70 family)
LVENGAIKRIQAGDDGAFARLYDGLAEPALRFAAAVLGSDGLSADAVQETFLRVYRGIGRFDAAKPFEPWFYRILVNECRRMLRWRRKLTPVDVIPERADLRPDHRELYEAVGALALPLREPVVLRYLLGYRDAEVARILGISQAAAKGRVKRARRELRRFLEKGDLT